VLLCRNDLGRSIGNVDEVSGMRVPWPTVVACVQSKIVGVYEYRRPSEETARFAH
jgi:hypothetical protein